MRRSTFSRNHCDERIHTLRTSKVGEEVQRVLDVHILGDTHTECVQETLGSVLADTALKSFYSIGHQREAIPLL